MWTSNLEKDSFADEAVSIGVGLVILAIVSVGFWGLGLVVDHFDTGDAYNMFETWVVGFCAGVIGIVGLFFIIIISLSIGDALRGRR